MSEQLPDGWTQAALGDIAKWGSGGTPSRINPNYYGGDIPWVKTGDLGPKKLSVASEFITDEGLQNSSAKIFPKGSVAIAMYGATIGKTSILDIDASTNQACAVAIPLQGIDRVFIYYLLNNEKENFIKKGKGGAQPNISQEILKAHLIQLPPLNEQIRIADKLDSVLAKVDAAQTRLEKIPTLLKRFRQAVLAAATSGELTREWRETSETRNDFLTWKFSNIPGSWKIKLLPEVSEARLGKMLDKNKNQGVPTRYLGNINVRWGKFDLDDLKEILISEKEREELKIQDGDLLLCEGGEPGRGAVWKGEKCDLTFQKALHRVRFDGSVLPEFALFCIENDYFQNRLSLLYTGTTIKHLTGKALKKYPIPVPPVDEQKEIVRRVESLFTLADTVEKQYLEAKKRIDRLTQSLLAKAFRGELVPQDPNDEPAAELLKRIQAERLARPSPKRISRERCASRCSAHPTS
jgi:type I restriction enzyme S subunit